MRSLNWRQPNMRRLRAWLCTLRERRSLPPWNTAFPQDRRLVPFAVRQYYPYRHVFVSRDNAHIGKGIPMRRQLVAVLIIICIISTMALAHAQAATHNGDRASFQTDERNIEDREKSLSSARSPADTCAILTDLARTYASAGRMDKLADTIVRIEQSCPNTDIRQIMWSVVVAKDQKPILADTLSALLASHRELSGARVYLAGLYVELGRKDDAGKSMKEAMEAAWNDLTKFQNVWLHSRFDASYTKELKQTIARRMLELDPKSREAALQVMWGYVEAGKTDDAVKTARHIVKETESGQALWSAAGVLNQAEKWSEAADAYKKSGQLAEANIADSFSYAHACIMAGRAQDGISIYKGVIAKNPSDNIRNEAFRGIYQVYADQKLYDKMVGVLMEAEERIADPNIASQVIYPSTMPDDVKRPLKDAIIAALKRSKGHPVTQIVLAMLYRECEQKQLARDTIRLVAAQYPKDAGVLRLVMTQCRCYPELQQLGIDVGRSVVKLEPDNATNWTLLTAFYMDANMALDGVQTARIIVSRWPGDCVAVSSAASVFEHFKQWDEAIDARTKAVAAAKEAANAFRFELARTYKAAGRDSQAISVCRQVIAQTKPNDTVKSLCRGMLAEMALQGGSSAEDAIQPLVDAAKAGSDIPFYNVLLELGNLDGVKLQALADGLETAISQHKDLFLCKILLGSIYERLGRQADARSLILQSLPGITSVPVLEYVVVNCTNCKDNVAAIDVSKRMAELDTAESPLGKQFLARSYMQAGQTDMAVQTAGKISSGHPDDPASLYAAGELLCDAEKYDEAEQTLNRAVSKVDESSAPDSPQSVRIKLDSWRALGNMFRRAGNKEKETLYLRMMLTVPDSDESRKWAEGRLAELGAAAE